VAREREAALLAAANAALSEEEALSAESLRQVELLNQDHYELYLKHKNNNYE
jgi:hypothetical protein